jgi:hypothetical protein
VFLACDKAINHPFPISQKFGESWRVTHAIISIFTHLLK